MLLLVLFLIFFFFFKLLFWQTPLHCRGDLGRVPFKGYRNCCRLGPDAWDEGIYLFLFQKEFFFLRNHFLVYASNNHIAYFFTPEPELTKQFYNSLVSLVRIRLGSLPFPKVAMEWQLELAVL